MFIHMGIHITATPTKVNVCLCVLRYYTSFDPLRRAITSSTPVWTTLAEYSSRSFRVSFPLA